MTTHEDNDVKSTLEANGTVSYKRLDGQSTPSTYSSIVLSNCSSEEDNDDENERPTLKWKRKRFLNNAEQIPNGSGALDKYTMSSEDNIATSFDDESRSLPSRRLPPIPADKLHRRNPHIVRQELRMLDDLVPDGDLVDIHLTEMPGLQNTDHWKRIAGRAVQSSPPLSRQYYQTVISTIELPDGQVPQPLGSYRRPGRTDSEPVVNTALCRLPRRRFLLGSFIAVVIVAIIVSVVLAVTIVRQSTSTATEYYEGSVYVRADFDQSLLDPSSTLAKNYKREFCSLIGTTLADTRTKYAIFYSTCVVTTFHNGSIIADFVLGFTQNQNVTGLSAFLNQTLVNKRLFDGIIYSIALNLTALNESDTDTNSTDNGHHDQPVQSTYNEKFAMTEQNSVQETQQQQLQQQPAHTSYTTVTYTTLEKGLSITISETITITNNNLDKSPINNKNYEVILIPTIENGKTVVVPTGNSTNEKTLLPAATTTMTNVIPMKSSSQINLLRPIKPISDANFAYIDASSDDRTCSSGDELVQFSLISVFYLVILSATSTLGDMTTRDSTTTASTTSLSDGTLTDSASTLATNYILPTASTNPPKLQPNRPIPPSRPPVKIKNQSSEDRSDYPTRLNSNTSRRQRRVVIPKNQRRLMQYELMPTGKVYYVDRPFYNEKKSIPGDRDDNSSAVLSTILSRSSSVDTLSEKRHRQHQHHRKYNQDASSNNPEARVNIGGRLASNNNLTTNTISSFKPISSMKKNRLSAFEPTQESLDQVFDVLIAADKRREEHDFWREKFENRSSSIRAPILNNRAQEPTSTNTLSFQRPKQTQLVPNSIVNNPENRSQSYHTNNKRTSLYEAISRQNGCLLEDCLRRRTQIAQHQLPPPSSERNYSPNTIYSTNYPKPQIPPVSKTLTPLATTAAGVPQPARILSLPNGRVGRAPHARQTSDELSSTSDIWAARSTVEPETSQIRKAINPLRAPSAVNRSRINQQKLLHNKRALSAEQQKTVRTENKTIASTTKSKFFDLFKFAR
ncbi:unnamed protein product [Adineta ricciae]|uniref:SEA domain-containing protein n=1 Tax=Adineta ricciae TaxID=249248 RepID=A0A813Q2I6_ADIRI|nr:unnamed protein product [Adineta ricciae]CAF1373581.1 unnamed protein product [Adineta ricciae]